MFWKRFVFVLGGYNYHVCVKCIIKVRLVCQTNKTEKGEKGHLGHVDKEVWLIWEANKLQPGWKEQTCSLTSHRSLSYPPSIPGSTDKQTNKLQPRWKEPADSLDVVGFFILFPFPVQLVDFASHVPLLFQIKTLKPAKNEASCFTSHTWTRFIIGVNVWGVCLAPPNIPSAFVLTFGNKVVCTLLLLSASWLNCSSAKSTSGAMDNEHIAEVWVTGHNQHRQTRHEGAWQPIIHKWGRKLLVTFFN